MLNRLNKQIGATESTFESCYQIILIMIYQKKRWSGATYQYIWHFQFVARGLW